MPNFKVSHLALALIFIIPSADAMTINSKSLADINTQPNPTSVVIKQTELLTSEQCAMQLMPIAKDIYISVSPKVQDDTNLRKLVKKEIKPQVFSGKLSVKSARKNAQAASVCLSLLKLESGQA